MNSSLRSLCLLVCAFLFSLWMSGCTVSSNKNPLLNCGEGFKQTAAGCVPADNYCKPECPTNERCIAGKCVTRDPDKNKKTVSCARICPTGTICKSGQCVTIPCKEKCKAGFVCAGGSCVRAVECNPPCPVDGYVCDSGLCRKLCVPSCDSKSEQCIQGTCEKKCPRTCSTGEFCRDGNCTKIEDNDKDGYPLDRDCDDKDKDRFPGNRETCDTKDNDCDGLVDNIDPTPCYTGPAGTLGKGECRAGFTVCDAGKQVCSKASKDGEIIPTKEVCDKKDNDCDGEVDEDKVCNP